MRPILFKGGRDFGKVVGIKGLYKDPSGRWFVRKVTNGKDVQKTVDFGGKNANFSTAERLAQRALRALESEHVGDVVECKTLKATKSALEKAQAECAKYVGGPYATGVCQRVAHTRLREAQGFAFVSDGMPKPTARELNDHNTELLSARIAEMVAQQKNVLAHEYWKHIKAIFSRAIQYGAHFGMNPAMQVKEPIKMDEKDERWISLDESARVQAELPYWMEKHGIETGKAKEVFLFHYLLTLGMRATSAILFNADDLKLSGDLWRYRVINSKTNRVMPVAQLIHPTFAKALKKIGAFSFTEKSLQNVLNEAIKEILGKDVSTKHLRKGFLTEVIESHLFSESDARRLTHRTQDVVESHYYALSQRAADAVSEWWNDRWFDAFDRSYGEIRGKTMCPAYLALKTV